MPARLLGVTDAPALDDLRQAYARALGGPGAPALAFTEALLARPHTFVLGACAGDDLVGFAVLFELPKAVHATVCGGLDDLFVAEHARGRGLARALIEQAVEFGRGRGWSHLRWIVPEDDLPAVRLYERIAERIAFRSYLIRIDAGRSL